MKRKTKQLIEAQKELKRLRADQSLLKTQLRQFFMMGRLATKVRLSARTSRGNYKCAMCAQTFPRSCIQIDHIKPFQSVKGFKNIHDYAVHLAAQFFKEENLQVLCTFCHQQKSGGWCASENLEDRGEGTDGN